jgi:hypothetical protein
MFSGATNEEGSTLRETVTISSARGTDKETFTAKRQ